MDIDSLRIEVEAASDQATSRIDQLINSLRNLRTASAGGNSGLNETARAIRNVNNEAGRSNLLSKFRDSLRQIQEQGKGLLRTKIGSVFQGMVSPIRGLATRLGTVAAAFKRIAFYRFIRSVIREITEAFSEGTKNLYQYSKALDGVGGIFAKNMDSMATSTLYFKNSLGAAVAPILNALIPALNSLISKIVEALNWVNQLFAKLGGASYWTRAKKVATEYAEAATKAGGAAKEALKYLAPFDELNVLPSENAGGGGGGAATPDYAEMFEEVDLGDKFAWIDKIREKFRELKESIDFGPLEEAWTRLKEAVQPFVDLVSEGLKWAWDNVLVPLSHWTIEEAAPAVVNALAAALEFLYAAIEAARPALDWLWKNIIQPIASALGRAFVDTLRSIEDVLRKLTNLLRGNTSFSKFLDSLSTGQTIALAFAAGISAAALAVGVLHGTVAVANAIMAGFTAVISSTIVQIGLLVGGVALVIAGMTNWIKTGELSTKTFAILETGILAVGTALTLLTGGPIPLIIAAVAGLAVAVVKNWEKITGAFQKVADAIRSVIDWFKNLRELLNQKISEIPLVKTVRDNLNSLKESVVSAWNTITGKTNTTPVATKTGKSGLINAGSNTVRTFATGGYPEDGLFYANHNEIVGRFSNGRTAVANNEQIEAGIARGVEEANEPVVDAILAGTAQLIQAITSQKGSGVTMDELARSVTRWQNRNARAMGL